MRIEISNNSSLEKRMESFQLIWKDMEEIGARIESTDNKNFEISQLRTRMEFEINSVRAKRDFEIQQLEWKKAVLLNQMRYQRDFEKGGIMMRLRILDYKLLVRFFKR